LHGITALGIAICALFAAAGAAHAQAAAAPEYRLHAGDQIAVTMPLTPELNASGPVGPDGRFTVPLAGQVAVAGLTATDAEKSIAKALRDAGLVADARPSVAVRQFGGTVFVGGEVRSPGQIALTSPLNPLQAIISAGGLLNTAKSKKVAILRQAGPASGNVYNFNVREFTKTGKSQSDISLEPGDIVFVPKSGIAEVVLWLDQHINGIIPDALHFNVNLGGGSNVNSTVSP
jgi:protein involved in polysaccharide export with SLBB domain